MTLRQLSRWRRLATRWGKSGWRTGRAIARLCRVARVLRREYGVVLDVETTLAEVREVDPTHCCTHCVEVSLVPDVALDGRATLADALDLLARRQAVAALRLPEKCLRGKRLHVCRLGVYYGSQEFPYMAFVCRFPAPSVRTARVRCGLEVVL